MEKKRKYKEVPVFQNEDQEREFWSTHDTADYFDLNEARDAVFPHLKPTTRPVSIRLNEWGQKGKDKKDIRFF